MKWTQQNTLEALLVVIIAMMMMAIFGPVFCGCVQEGAVQVSITADVDLDEVRGITLANAQMEGMRNAEAD